MNALFTTTLRDKYYHNSLLKVNRIRTEVKLLAQGHTATYGHTATNSKPRQPAFELNLEISRFYVRIKPKNIEIIKMRITLLCWHSFTHVVPYEPVIFELGLREQG